MERVKGRCLFESAREETINCPSDAQVGDLIILFYGVKTPCVVRPLKPLRTQSGQQIRFCLIEECYVRSIRHKSQHTREALGKSDTFRLV
jgi:hypothetical protein